MGRIGIDRQILLCLSATEGDDTSAAVAAKTAANRAISGVYGYFRQSALFA